MKNFNKKIIILGGDGFCGWPTALYLSKHGYSITILDSLIRRKIDKELGTKSLTPIKSIKTRIKTWNKINKFSIKFIKIDLSLEEKKFLKIIKSIKPFSIIHFAEQRSAPYSMKNSYLKKYTINNNSSVTTNVVNVIVESKLDIHLIHLGTMGVYGYEGNIEIPEGYLDVYIENKKKFTKKNILFPTNPGSVYHLTKSIDQLIFQYYNKNDHIRITDLHQGIVWGTQTEDTKKHTNLVNRFDYDGDFGTVLNRFLVQSVIGLKMTVYGKGHQTRAFININDTVKCIKIALENPPKKYEKVKIFNQATETFQLLNLAKKISKLNNAKFKYYNNPRNEKEKNSLILSNKNFLSAGLKPIKLKFGLLEEITDIVQKYKKNIIKSKIPFSSFWKNK